MLRSGEPPAVGSFVLAESFLGVNPDMDGKLTLMLTVEDETYATYALTQQSIHFMMAGAVKVDKTYSKISNNPEYIVNTVALNELFSSVLASIRELGFDHKLT